MKQKGEFEKALSAKEADLLEKERAIEQLKAQISGNETEKKLAVSEAVSQKEKEIEELKAKLQNSESERKLAVLEAVQGKEKELSQNATVITEWVLCCPPRRQNET